MTAPDHAPDPPGLVASDLDGTLLRSDGTVGDRTVATLRRLSDAGIPFVIVTGRPLRWIGDILDRVSPPGPGGSAGSRDGARPRAPAPPVVCSNGTIVYDPATDSMIDQRPLSVELLTEVVRRLRERVEGVAFAVEGGTGLRYERGYRLGYQDSTVTVAELPEMLTGPANKLLVRLNGGSGETARRSLAGLVEVTWSDDPGLLELSPAGVTKATGLAAVAERYGVPPERVLAFGDMPNDLPMFAFAGRGVAMANADPSLRAVADDVTASNDADGVAGYLDRILDRILDGRTG